MDGFAWWWPQDDRSLFAAGFGEGFFVAGDGLEDGVEAEAFEDVADWGAGLGEDDSAAGVFGGGGGGEEHGEGGGGDHVDFGEIDEGVAGGTAGEFLELVLHFVEAFHGEAALELEHAHIAEFGVFQRSHECLVFPHRPLSYISCGILPQGRDGEGQCVHHLWGRSTQTNAIRITIKIKIRKRTKRKIKSK